MTTDRRTVGKWGKTTVTIHLKVPHRPEVVRASELAECFGFLNVRTDSGLVYRCRKAAYDKYGRKMERLHEIWRVDPDSPIRERDFDGLDEKDWPQTQTPQTPQTPPQTQTPPHPTSYMCGMVGKEAEKVAVSVPSTTPAPTLEDIRKIARSARLSDFEEASALRAKRWQVASESERLLLEEEGREAKRVFDEIEETATKETAAVTRFNVPSAVPAFKGVPTRRDAEWLPSAEGSMNLDFSSF